MYRYGIVRIDGQPDHKHQGRHHRHQERHHRPQGRHHGHRGRNRDHERGDGAIEHQARPRRTSHWHPVVKQQGLNSLKRGHWYTLLFYCLCQRKAGPECVPLQASEYLIRPIEELAVLGGNKPGSGHTSHGCFYGCTDCSSGPPGMPTTGKYWQDVQRLRFYPYGLIEKFASNRKVHNGRWWLWDIHFLPA